MFANFCLNEFIIDHDLAKFNQEENLFRSFIIQGVPEKRGRFSIFVPPPLWFNFLEFYSFNFLFKNGGDMDETKFRNVLGGIKFKMKMLESCKIKKCISM